MGKNELKLVRIQNTLFIPFEAMHKRYGRAEFTICPVYKYGYLRQCYIYHQQQEDVHFYYLWEGKANGYSFTGYEGLEPPRIWTSEWCKEHKCNSVRLYVPTDSKFLKISLAVGSLGIDFTKTDWNAKTRIVSSKSILDKMAINRVFP